ncbi:MAG: transcription-repair coupling factor [Opitutales bacterium]|nr:transcription-repair coupling factor [Opitutales bacterium]
MKPVVLPRTASACLLTGVAPALRGALLEELAGGAEGPCVVFLPDSGEAEGLGSTIAEIGRLARGVDKAPRVMIFPEPPEAEADDARAFEKTCDRMAVLSLLASHPESFGHPPLFILTTAPAFFAPAPPRAELSARELRLRAGSEAGFEAVRSALVAMDYDNEALCEYPGQFAVRGGLIDVYPINATAPVRIDFFGDEIDTLRAFDPTTQRSTEELTDVVIAPKSDGGAAPPGSAHILDYFAGQTRWFWVEPDRIAAAHPVLSQRFERLATRRSGFDSLFRRFAKEGSRFVGLTELDGVESFFPPAAAQHPLQSSGLEIFRARPEEEGVGAARMELEEAARSAFLAQLAAWQAAGENVLIFAHNDGEAARLREVIAEEVELAGFAPPIAVGHPGTGFRLVPATGQPLPLSWPGLTPGRPLTVVTDAEIFGRYRTRPAALRKRRLPTRTQVDHLLDFAELHDGDPLVHLSHGVCLFRGLQRMEVRGKSEEVISLEFADKLTLHVPLYESHLLTRYVGLSKVSPKLGKLGSGSWEKARQAAEVATLDFAAQLLSLQAKRMKGEGHAFRPDTDWQRAFEDSFPYNETPDQARAIAETKADMERPGPMDRLICGDVGFGKTEVAIRAAFKAVMDGHQVAILVPTTILAQQHFLTFKERMADFPVTVEVISRFRTQAEQSAIVQQLAQGGIDIIIGTHRLLARDIRFKQLGLLIVDEEHRFGVRHKERMKHLKADIDVLTMSATPIPRTLYLALMGARDLSVIETPPVDRLPIQTIVRGYDPDLVRRAIEDELARGGQVFYLHNRVQTIDSVAGLINELVPKARVIVGHGQMPEHTLERVMTRFVAGEYDVLVCTTIIENGLDIPNCNTIIIEGADRFGLSQLYQLRGRVGRFKRQAYAYLLLHRHARVLDLARKRLSAMRQYNQLGAGFRISMRDLELRGSGNLLGHQQSGHIASVGFELYCQLLRQSVARLKGEKAAARIRATVNLDFVSVGEGQAARSGRDETDRFGVLREVELEEGRIPPVEARLPESYIEETRLRIDFYRRLAMAASVDEVREIEAALKDRFGEPPPPAIHLLRLTCIRTRAEEVGLRSVETEGNRLKCLRASGQRDDYVKMGGRFPRLSQRNPLKRLREIEQIIERQRP